MQVTDPDPSPPARQASPLRQPDARMKPTSLARPWRVASLAALVVVLVIAAFVGLILLRNSSLYGGHLTGTGPITPRIPSSVYIVADHTMYAIDVSKGASRWQTPADGSLTPDPTVARGIVYTSAIPNGEITARRASDGAVLWSKLVVQAEGKRLALDGDTLYMTTDMIGGEVLFPGYVHGVYALRASDGAVRWHYDTADPVISPPLVVDGVVYVGVGASLVALRASNGTQLWQRPLTTAGGHPYLPLWLASSAGTIYTYGREQNPDQPYSPSPPASNDATVFALSVSDGAVRWSRTLDGAEYDQDTSTPVIADDIVYVRSNGLGSQAQARGVPSYGFGLHALRASDGAPLWTYPTAITQPVATGGTVYAGDTSGNVIALHGTDSRLIWKHPIAGATSANQRMSLTLANDILYISVGKAAADEPSSSDVIAVKALRASNGQQRWACPLPGSPAIQMGAPVFAA